LVSGKRPLRIPAGVPIGYVEPRSLTAGSSATIVFRLALEKSLRGDSLVLRAGGHRWLGLPIHLQGEDSSAEGYVSCGIEGGRELKPVRGGKPEKRADLFRTAFEIPEGGIPGGSVLRLVVGDTSGGGKGIVAPIFSASNAFLALTEEPGPSTLRPNGLNWVGAFIFDILGGTLDHLRALAPSTVGIGDEFSITVRPQDENGNLSPQRPGRLVVGTGEEQLEVVTVPENINPAGAIEIGGLSISREGIHRILVEDWDLGIGTRSNPILVGDEPEDLFWGLIHEHTEISDGVGSLETCYRNMRHGSRLDFGATSDHDHRFETTDGMFEMTRRAVAQHNDPGRFTTFLGYEWAKWRRNGDGDRNVYYPGEDGPFYRSGEGEYDDPDKLFGALGGRRSIVIPHHTAYEGNFCDWSQHDPSVERLVEIYSVFGSSERSADQGNPYPIRAGQYYDPRWLAITGERPKLGECPAGFVQNALALGWKVGFTGGGDMHCSHPGDDVRSGYPPLAYRPGLTGVWAGENSREGLWKSLVGRRCYATTGARMVLRMRVNGLPMGSELVLGEDEARKIEFSASGTGEIDSVELVRNNSVFRSEEPCREDVSFIWTDDDAFEHAALPPARWVRRPFIFYYVRLVQADGEMGWTSPVWVERPV